MGWTWGCATKSTSGDLSRANEGATKRTFELNRQPRRQLRQLAHSVALNSQRGRSTHDQVADFSHILDGKPDSLAIESALLDATVGM